MQISEKFIWAFLVIGALFGGAVISYTAYDTWQSLPEDERQALIATDLAKDTAKQFLETQFKKSLDTFTATVDVAEPQSGLTFLYKALGDEAATQYLESHNFGSVEYTVRFFEELSAEEYSVTIDAYTNVVTEFSRVIPEDTQIGEGSIENARSVARQFMETSSLLRGVETEELDVSEYTTSGGTEYFITYKLLGSEIDSSYGKGYREASLSVQGDVVGEYSTDIIVPEAFTRELRIASSYGELMGLLSVFAWGIMSLAAFVVMIRMFIRKYAQWKTILGITLVLFACTILDLANTFPTFIAWYDTTTPMSIYVATTIIMMLIVNALMLLGFFVPGVAGISKALATSPERIAPLTSLPVTDGVTRTYIHALLRGYLLGIFVLGLTYGIYWLGERYLGVWYSLEGGSGIDSTILAYVPAFSYALSYGLIAAITEEFLFRMFGILVFRRFFKSTGIAVFFATLVWAFAHTDGTIFPVWFRGAEVFVTGLIFAYFFLRYNILTTIVAHYVNNTIIAGGILFLTFGLDQIVPVVIMLLAPVLIFGGVYLYGRFIRKMPSGEIKEGVDVQVAG